MVSALLYPDSVANAVMTNIYREGEANAEPNFFYTILFPMLLCATISCCASKTDMSNLRLRAYLPAFT